MITFTNKQIDTVLKKITAVNGKCNTCDLPFTAVIFFNTVSICLFVTVIIYQMD